MSAYVQAEADPQHRNANFVSVGALVPRSSGRLGKSWLHAVELRRLAQEVVSHADDREGLEQYWKQHQDVGGAEATTTSANSRDLETADSTQPSRARSRSNASGVISTQDRIPSDHPALSASSLLECFGPLLFPLIRSALLRRRILILGSPPVQRNCNYAYLLSVLSSIPISLADAVHTDAPTTLRMNTLFSVGIHDIPFLADRKHEGGWLACTTDDILGDKKDLYDVLVKMPNSASTNERPRLHTSDGTPIKATQRDLRRYRLLRAELDRVLSISSRYRDDPESPAINDDAIPLMRASTVSLLQDVKRAEVHESEVVEPVSWTAMAYNGFMWWASAGEMEAWENEETRTDRQLFDGLAELEDLLPRPDRSNDSEDSNNVKKDQAIATVVTAYSHRLTSQILLPLTELVEAADDDTEEGIADAAITITDNDVRAMGLDNWSLADKNFVKEMMRVYFSRDAVVDVDGTRICGVRIC